jgi:membrane-associated protein
MFHLIPLIKTLGYLGIAGIVFCENGMLFAFFFPGDTLLFSVGVLAYEKYFNLPLVIIVLSIAAIAGGFFGYFAGKKIGPLLFTKEDSVFFKKKNLARAEVFFKKYGIITILIGKFVPIVRTFAPTIAGVANMKFKIFAIYNILGGIIWCSTITLIGYFLGKKVPNIDAYILPFIGIVCLMSLIPPFVEVIKKKTRQN